LVTAVLAASCQPKTVVVEQRVVETVEVEKNVEKEVTKVVSATYEESVRRSDPGSPPMAAPYRANRMIIKNAELRLLMEDVGSGVDRVTQVAVDTFGYVLSSRTWLQDNLAYATITLGVPVDEFESAMRRLRGMAVQVIDETISGTDVTDQYVDLESRLRNLEATEARIRSFLDQATDVEESLHINAELSEITAQIEEIKGHMSYLKDRAAYSTITVHLDSQRPTPTNERLVWQPSETFREATRTLGDILSVVGDTAIWAFVVAGPFLVPITAILWLVLRAHRGKHKTI
jgi:hypothetical protein